MIAIYDDQKGRGQSFEAVFTDQDEWGFTLLDLTGYGADEMEAIADLAQKLKAYQEALAVVTTEVCGRYKGRS